MLQVYGSAGAPFLDIEFGTIVSQKTASLVRQIAARFPGLIPILEEHLKDNEEILPHVFFGDLTRYIESLHSMGEVTGSPAELSAILQCLEDAFATGDTELQELVSVSFLEHLPQATEPGAELRKMLGENMRRQLHVIEAWRPVSAES